MGRMLRRISIVVITLLTCFVSLTSSAAAADKDTGNAIVLTFKDGHQQSFPLADVARIEFKTSAAATKSASIDVPDRHHFVGKWNVGDGRGGTFEFRLDDSGEAHNNVTGGMHGTWTYTNGEAHITWDNGWHDIIRRVGVKYRKFAFEPGRSLDGSPSNEGDAKKNAEPI
jgi:hypothetical protein